MDNHHYELCHSGVGRNPAHLFDMQLGFVPLRRTYSINWILASAGMTGYALR
jgi:hypothetical protein